ncbi:MAG: MMPL family transporter [Variibacter sp.]|nr:MMPL family transporter [Variibacter sp.]
MLKYTIVRTVEYCAQFAWVVISASLFLAVVCGYYTANKFAINTDVNTLISPTLDWRKRELDFEKQFPGRHDSILMVVEAPTPELVAQATAALTAKLQESPNLFRSVHIAGGGPFFEQNGLLYLPTQEVEGVARNLGMAGQIIGALAGDPSLRGLTDAMSFGLYGVQRGMFPFEGLQRPMAMAADTLEPILAGKSATFSWNTLLKARPPEPGETRKFVDIRPVLDYSALEPGHAATTAIRKAVQDLNLASAYGAKVRLTGPVPIADEEFATVKDNALLVHSGTVIIVLTILWLALRSPKLILAVFINLVVGLALTAATGLWLVGSLNLISIAFAVLFVGIGVDFGIQFAVRYRAERHEVDDIGKALARTAAGIGAPLTLAAGAVAAGFLSFLPTAYRGVSELGQIAGAGMVIAFVTSVTLLPALIRVFNPGGEPEEVGYKSLAPLDRFLERNRVPVIVGTALASIGGLPLLYHLSFDFNPINLRSPKVESISTFLDLRRDPNIGANAVSVVASSQEEAAQVTDRLAKLPEVARVTTARTFVPDDQERKLAIIKGLADELGPQLSEAPGGAPTDEENIEALKKLAGLLAQVGGSATGPAGDAAKRLQAAVTKLAEADKATRDKVERAMVDPLKTVLGELRNLLKAGPVTLDTLPADLRHTWIDEKGAWRVEANPKGDPNDNETVRKFASAVQAIYPNVVGGPISILESGRTIVNAFIQAGIWALVAIAILLWIVLKRFGDVLLTLIPLLLAGVVTLEICVMLGMPLNFANIIALPLLLGVGVAFKIYYIMAWRAGQTDLLQTSLTRAVIWSALTTATAFGSLWLSSHPGTSSMGELLALSLVTTLCAAVLFQPVLMGKPRELRDS